MKGDELKEQNTARMCSCIGTYKSFFLLNTQTPTNTYTCPSVLFHALSLNSTHTYSLSLLYVINQLCAAHPSAYFMFISLYQQQPASSVSIIVNDIPHFPDCLLALPRYRICFSGQLRKSNSSSKKSWDVV